MSREFLENSQFRGVTPETDGGQGGSLPAALDDGLPVQTSLKMERRAIQQGWLKKKDGQFGLDEEKVAAIAERSVQLALHPKSAVRTVLSASRNVIAIVGQIMKGEKAERKAANEQREQPPHKLITLVEVRSNTDIAVAND